MVIVIFLETKNKFRKAAAWGAPDPHVITCLFSK